MANPNKAVETTILRLNQTLFGKAAGTTTLNAALPQFPGADSDAEANAYAQALIDEKFSGYKPLDVFRAVLDNISASNISKADKEALAEGMVPFVDAGLSIGATVNLLSAYLYNSKGSLPEYEGAANPWNATSKLVVNQTDVAFDYAVEKKNTADSSDILKNITEDRSTVDNAINLPVPPEHIYPVTSLSDGILSVRVGTLNNYGRALEILDDGHLLIAGNSNGAGQEFSAVRLQPNGALDTTFAIDGAFMASLDEGNDRVYDIALQSDGKIILAGTVATQGSDKETDFGLVRLGYNGTLDSSFGDGGKVVQSVFQGTNPYGTSDNGRSVALQPDGKIVVGGYARASEYKDVSSAVRLNTDGSLDTGFAEQGILTLSPVTPDMYSSYATALVQPDGKILLAGSAWGSTGSYVPYQGIAYLAVVVRLNPDGSLDDTFHSPIGKSTTRFEATAALLQPDGKILVVGNKEGDKTDVSAVRFNADGSLDNDFGEFGTQILSAPGFESVQGVTLDAQGRILLAGASGTQATIWRLLPNGQLDKSFGSEGMSIFDSGGYNSENYAVAVQNDGKIVASGSYTYSPYQGRTDFLVMRLDDNGQPDPTFTGKQQPFAYGLAEEGVMLALVGSTAPDLTDYQII